MASLVIGKSTVTVSLSAAEKIEAPHGDVSVPRSPVSGVREVADGMDEVHGLQAPGTGLPCVILVGTFREPGRTTTPELPKGDTNKSGQETGPSPSSDPPAWRASSA